MVAVLTCGGSGSNICFSFWGKKQSQLHICVGHARAGHVTIVLSKNGRICLTSQKPLKSRHYVYLTFAVEALETMFFLPCKGFAL